MATARLPGRNEFDPTNGALPEYAGPPDPGDFVGIAKWLHEGGGQNRGKVPGVVQPEQNPLAQTLYQQSTKRARDYEKALPGISDSLYNTASGQASRGYQQTQRGIRNSANSRGLLNSGMEAGQEAQAKSDAQTGLAGKRADINQGLLSNLQGLEGNAFTQAGTLAQPGPQTAQGDLSAYQSNIAQQMADSQMQSQLYGGIAGGIGSVAGAGLASTMYQQQQPQNGYVGYSPNTASSANPYGPYSGGMYRPGMTMRNPSVDYGM